MKYLILMANNPGELQQVINDFITHNPDYTFCGGPYCDNLGHYQALTKTKEKSILLD